MDDIFNCISLALFLGRKVNLMCLKNVQQMFMEMVLDFRLIHMGKVVFAG